MTKHRLLPILPLMLAAAMVLAIAIGRYPLAVGEVGRFFLASGGLCEMANDRYQLLYNLIVRIRLPRILAAVLVGGSLSISGGAYQSVFRNPLVSPGILGVLAGAAFGSALGIMISGNWLTAQLLAFAMGVVAVLLGVAIATIFDGASSIMLVLGGVISGALFSALLSLVKYLADPYDKLPTIVYWLMGSLAQADLGRLAWFSLPMVAGILMLILLGRDLDALAMGDEEALCMGVPVRRIRYLTIGCATMISAFTVSLAGMIGWVGLIVPHISRFLVGPNNARLLPASVCVGGLFLLLADSLARTIAPVEIPIGIVTELIGIPAFLLVLRRARGGWR